MLFLTRKKGECIIINDEIKLTVQEINHNHVKLSFEHPAGTRILRQEVYNRIQEENRLASTQAESIRSFIEHQRTKAKE